MRLLLYFIDLAFAIYIWLLLATAALSWLIGFSLVDRRRRAVAVIDDFLRRVTEPLLRPVRVLLPELGGVDISTLVAIIILASIRYLIALYILPKLL
jgi:YggT family protein